MMTIEPAPVTDNSEQPPYFPGQKYGWTSPTGVQHEFDYRSLDQAKAERRLDIGLHYDEAIAAGAPYQGKMLQIDNASLLYINGKVTQAVMALSGAVTWPVTRWRMLDNTFIQVPTEQDMIALGSTAAAYVEALDNRLWDAQQAIESASTNIDVDAINL